MAVALMAAVMVDRDHVVTKLEELAKGAVVKSREKIVESGRPRRHGMELNEHRYWNGVLQGLCMSIAALTGERTEQLVQQFQGVAGAKPWNGF